jgi:D-alanyl-D-alanine carboxypeptidase
MKKILASICIFASVLSGCGSTAPEPERARPPGAAPPIELPPSRRAVPAYAIVLDQPATDAEVEVIKNIDGVATAALMPRGEVKVEAEAGTGTMVVGVVDPLDFRPVTPDATRNAQFVWSTLLRGDAVVTFSAAEEMSIDGPATIGLGAAGDVKVGAYADNGVPNYADILVNEKVGEELGLVDARLVVVGSKPGARRETIRRQAVAKLEGEQLVNLLPETPSFLTAGSPEMVGVETGLIPTMPFELAAGGFIEPDEAWVDQNISTAVVPILGEVTCHRIMLPRLFQALAEIEQAGLAEHIRPDDYGGCYVPRFIDRDPKNPLSMHAFGLAADLNVSTNLLGSKGDMDPRVVEIFNEWGFTWGGIWDRPDPMHFELSRLVEV